MRKQYHFWPGDQGIDAWDVDRLIGLTRDLSVEEVPLAKLHEVDSVYWFDSSQRPTVRNVVEHFRLVQEVDPQHPIILGPTTASWMACIASLGPSWKARRISQPFAFGASPIRTTGTVILRTCPTECALGLTLNLRSRDGLSQGRAAQGGPVFVNVP
jgi:hypothetical protein